MKKEIEAVKKIIKASSIKLNERIKWNAPSYYYTEDIARVSSSCRSKIKSPLLQGDYKDRRLVYFTNKAEATKNKANWPGSLMR